MIKISDLLLNERYLNAIGFDDKSMAIRRKYIDQVWEILQQSYQSIGGLKGSGLNTKEDLINNIPFWKIKVRGEVVKYVILYKDKNGRKSVAIGSDKSKEAIELIQKDFKHEITRSYGEKSKNALGALMKSVPWEVLRRYTLTPEQVMQASQKKDITPIKDVPVNEWPKDAKVTLDKYPMLKDYGYLRKIKNELTFKVGFGTPGMSIK